MPLSCTNDKSYLFPGLIGSELIHGLFVLLFHRSRNEFVIHNSVVYSDSPLILGFRR